MHTLRTRFGKDKDIVAEFLPPIKDLGKVMIFCGGMPGIPKNKEVLELFSKKNYWAMSVRYRGTWESDGEFLARSPEQDILDVMSELDKPLVNLWDNTEYNIDIKKIVVVGVSFGGPAALLVSGDKRVDKVVGFSPVVDWQSDSPDEPMDFLGEFIKEAFGNGYRFSNENWQRLSRGEFYNPITELDKIDKSKILLFHAVNDMSVTYESVKNFSEKADIKLITIPRGGHIGDWVLKKYKYRRKVWKFLNK